MNIEISNQSGITCDENSILDLAEFALTEMGIHQESELNIRIVDEDVMTDLHVEWMGLPGPTDVLSFPMDELKPNSASKGPGVVGDIVLCPEFAKKSTQLKTLADELHLLTVHGVLHLLGFDHAELTEEKAMFSLQEKILTKWRANS